MIEFHPSVLDAVRRHAEQVKYGNEIVGMVLLDGERAIKYIRLRNRSRQPHRFVLNYRDYQGRTPRGLKRMMLHSHPSEDCYPSVNDLSGAARDWLNRPYAIYCVPSQMLGVFRLHKNREAFDVLGYVTPGQLSLTTLPCETTPTERRAA